MFYREKLFGGDIVLDQGWALRAIYALFDRNLFLPLFQDFGRFTRGQLAGLVWQNYELAERELFLGMMMQCGICFPNHPRNGSADGDENTEFIAPDLLPARPSEIDAFMHRRPEGVKVLRMEFDYEFLHDGTFRQFMCEVGRYVGDAGHYWKNEFHLYELGHACEARVTRAYDLARPGAGAISIATWGREPRWLLSALKEALLTIRIGKVPTVTGDLDEPAPRSLGIGRDPESHDVGVHEEHDLLTALEKLEFGTLPIDRPIAGDPKIFISYAWGDETDERERIVSLFCEEVAKDDREVIRDKTHMRHGNLISDFIRQIGAGECVIVVISDKYLRSAYCMSELHQIFQRCAGYKDEFLERVIPLVLDDVEISNLPEQKVYRDYWIAAHAEHEAIIKECLNEVDPEHLRECQLMGQFSKEVLKILKFVQDQLMPRGFKAITEDKFSAVIDRLPAKSDL